MSNDYNGDSAECLRGVIDAWAHDLRNMTNTLLLATGLARDGVLDHEDAATLDDDARALAFVVDALIEAARSGDARPPRSVASDPGLELSTMLDAVRRRLARAGGEFSVDPPPDVRIMATGPAYERVLAIRLVNAASGTWSVSTDHVGLRLTYPTDTTRLALCPWITGLNALCECIERRIGVESSSSADGPTLLTMPIVHSVTSRN